MSLIVQRNGDLERFPFRRTISRIREYAAHSQYYHRTRTHLSLDKDCPQTRSISQPTGGKIIAFPEVGGLHHRYERRAA
jgi:hypothetical protein